MACNFCNAQLFVKTVKHTPSILAPLTRAGELREELENLTGEMYALLPNLYCPMCGAKVRT